MQTPNSFTTLFVLISMAMWPLGASAEMQTLRSSDLTGLERVEDTGFLEFYQNPDLGNFGFTSIYIAPAVNAVAPRYIYEQSLRPRHIDELTVDFHARMVAGFEATGLLTDEPDEDSLVITPSLTYVTEYDEWTTGTHLGGQRVQDRLRGRTVMEMTWHAGPGGELVAAFRDGRMPHIYTDVSDREDRFTDARDSFDAWAGQFASFFLPEPQDATN